MTSSNAQLRQFIMQAFSDEELETLCFDYFPEVQQNFTDGMTKNRKALALISYCDARGRRDDLLATLRREREGRWEAAFGASAASDAPRPAPASAAPATHNPRQIFLSHATADAEFAQQLAADLREEGWAVWIAPDSIQPGEKWVEAINRGLEESGVFVVVLSPDAVASRWVQTETNLAIALEHRDLMRFISLEHKACKPPLVWTNYQYIPFRSSYEAGLLALLNRLDGKKPGSATTREAVRPARSFIGDPDSLRNHDKQSDDRYSHPKTGIEMIRIPAGPFLFGSTEDDELANSDEKPQRKMELPEFWIGRYPVTNAQYKRFLEANSEHRVPSDWDEASRSFPDGKADHPVVYVSWEDATAFCVWAGLHLPTEQEWEKAARGDKDDRTWPWGSDWVDGRCNTSEAGIGTTTPVGRYSTQSDSPYGCADMAGNVWEWTNSWYDSDRDTRVLRGGSWDVSQRGARVAYRLSSHPVSLDCDIGFRVAAPVVSVS